MYRFANPSRFLNFSRPLVPWLLGAATCGMGLATYWGLFDSPSDYLQKDSVRIMYVHVPAAWMALMVYTSMAIASVGALVWRHPLAEISALAAAPIGAIFTLIALMTGSIWGYPTWGTFWSWDARITSVLILFFQYLAYMVLVQSFEDPARGRRAGAILLILGLVNVVIVKYSVEWWNTLHQPASISTVEKIFDPSIHADFLWPLFTMFLGYFVLFLGCLFWRMDLLLLQNRNRMTMLRLARGQG